MNARTAPILCLLGLACGPVDDGRLDRGVVGDLEAQTSGDDVTPEGGFGGVDVVAPCPPDLSRCEFERYNIDVRVSDRFVLTRFLEGCDGEIGVDFAFAYEDDTTWNLTAFNTDEAVEIVEADLDGGNHGEGEYRIELVGADGASIDHATLRIDHDEESDVRPGDDLPPPARNTDCGPGTPPPDDSDRPPGDDPLEGDDDASFDDDCGADCV